jgi:hypothetical protein
MKRRILLIFTTLLVFLCACTEEITAVPVQVTLTPSISPEPTVTPAEPSVIAVFGAEKSDAFLSGILEAAEGSGIEILPVSGGVAALATFNPGRADAAIVYVTGSQEALLQTSIPTYVFDASGQDLALDIPHLTYAGDTAPKLALDCALSYPPHLAPVRMIGLFTSESSRAYALWTSAKANGDVFAKQEFFLDSSEAALTDWLNETLPLYYPGMLDAVFAETGALAVAAADVLASLGRDDVEVFAAGTDENAAAKLSPILICAVGADDAEAGARCYTEAAKLLSGDAAQSGDLLPAISWYTENP